MKPDAIYYFCRIPEYPTRYIQIGHKGKAIPGFPSVYKRGKNKGEKYVVFRRTSSFYNQNGNQFTHALELVKSKIITPLVFSPYFSRQAFGANKEYAILIEFSKDFEELEIWFFKDMQESAPRLFLKKQAGGIPEIVKNDAISVRYRTRK